MVINICFVVVVVKTSLTFSTIDKMQKMQAKGSQIILAPVRFIWHEQKNFPCVKYIYHGKSSFLSAQKINQN